MIYASPSTKNPSQIYWKSNPVYMSIVSKTKNFLKSSEIGTNSTSNAVVMGTHYFLHWAFRNSKTFTYFDRKKVHQKNILWFPFIFFQIIFPKNNIKCSKYMCLLINILQCWKLNTKNFIFGFIIWKII